MKYLIKKVFIYLSIVLFLTTILTFSFLEFNLEFHFKNLNLSSQFFGILYIFILLIINFIPVLVVILLKNRFWKVLFCFLNPFYYIFNIFLVYYLYKFSVIFDPNFFIYNIDGAFTTILNSIGISNFVLIIISLLVFIFLMEIVFLNAKLNLKMRKFSLVALILGIIFAFSFFGAAGKRNSITMFRFFNHLLRPGSGVVRDYNQKYNNIYDNYRKITWDNFNFDYLNNQDADVYFIHLESVNSNLVNQKITPNLMKASKLGVYFNNFFSNSVQTIRAEESILCALPSSLGKLRKNKLNDYFDFSSITCLPKIFNKIGYKTLFFKSHDLVFSNTGGFMKKIGFSEIHNNDIMRKDDPQLHWGYREDIFYQRVLNYLKKYSKDNKFVYVAVSSSNHYPFSSDFFKEKLPYDNSQGFGVDNIMNTTYIQDKYFGEFLDALVRDPKKKFLFIFSDNSWPIAVHRHNKYNENYAYRENFSIPFVFIAKGLDNIGTNKRVNDYYSQIDIFNTVLDIFNIKTNQKYLGSSFYANLLKRNPTTSLNDNCILSIQPYHDKFLSFFYDSNHYIYDIYKDRFVYYNLLEDPDEHNPFLLNNFKSIYNKCFTVRKN